MTLNGKNYSSCLEKVFEVLRSPNEIQLEIFEKFYKQDYRKNDIEKLCRIGFTCIEDSPDIKAFTEIKYIPGEKHQIHLNESFFKNAPEGVFETTITHELIHIYDVCIYTTFFNYL